MELVKPRDAARDLGVSYPTLKQWIYAGKIRSVRTAGGHHRIPAGEIERLTGSGLPGPSSTRTDRSRTRVLEGISGRNKLRGTVTEVRFEGLLAQVTIDVSGQAITSIITRGAAEELRLERGVEAYALIKATEVMIVRP